MSETRSGSSLNLYIHQSYMSCHELIGPYSIDFSTKRGFLSLKLQELSSESLSFCRSLGASFQNCLLISLFIVTNIMFIIKRHKIVPSRMMVDLSSTQANFAAVSSSSRWETSWTIMLPQPNAASPSLRASAGSINHPRTLKMASYCCLACRSPASSSKFLWLSLCGRRI